MKGSKTDCYCKKSKSKTGLKLQKLTFKIDYYLSILIVISSVVTKSIAMYLRILAHLSWYQFLY